jgi:hypothetical protein
MKIQERIEYLKERTQKRKQNPSQSKASQQRRYTLPCIHEGAVLEWCNTCNGDMKHVRDCDIYEKCTRGNVSDKVKACVDCKDYQPESESSRVRKEPKHTPHKEQKKPTPNTPPERRNSMAKQQVTREAIAKKLAERKAASKQGGIQNRVQVNTTGRTFAAGKKTHGITWEYGITTVDQRQTTTLPITVASLRKAGFDKPRLFVDGSNALASYAVQFQLPVIVRGIDNIRTFGNWYLAMVEMYMRNPNADRYSLFQDDIIASKGLKEYLEHTPYPNGKDGRPKGYLNLITYPQNEGLSKVNGPLPGPEETGWYPSNQMGKGAQGLVFDNAALVALLTSDYMVNRVKDERRGWQGLDGGIVTAMKRMGYIEYVHTPSLIRHIGEETSMGPDHPKTQPVDKSFRGEEWDAMTLVKEEYKEVPIQILPEKENTAQEVITEGGYELGTGAQDVTIGDDGR